MSARNTKYNYLISRRSNCICGYGIGARRVTWKSGNGARYYRCNTYRREVAEAPCGQPNFRVDQVDRLVWDWLEEIITDPNTVPDAIEARERENERIIEGRKGKLEEINQRIDVLQEDLDKLVELHLRGKFDSATIEKKQAELISGRDALIKERNEILRLLDPPEEAVDWGHIRSYIDNLKARLGKLSFDERREAVEFFNVLVVMGEFEGKKSVFASCLLKDAELITPIV